MNNFIYPQVIRTPVRGNNVEIVFMRKTYPRTHWEVTRVVFGVVREAREFNTEEEAYASYSFFVRKYEIRS